MYYSGRSLDGLYIEMKAHLAAIHQLNQMEQLLLLTLYLRLVEALLGITDIESHATISSESGGTGRTAFMFVTKLELFVFFQSWDKASKILLQTNDVHSGEKKPWQPTEMILCIYSFSIYSQTTESSRIPSFSRFLPTRSFCILGSFNIDKVGSICYRMAQEEMVEEEGMQLNQGKHELTSIL